jgi:hypothetical protein
MSSATSSPTEQQLAFFTELMCGLPDGHLAYVWAKGSRPYYPQSPEDALSCVDRLGQPNPYVGVALLAPGAAKHVKEDSPAGAMGRPAAKHAAGIFGMWIDLDVMGAPDGKGGTKPTGAPHLDAALEIVDKLLQPTLLVASGGGVHAWWLFLTPWLFADEEERQQAGELVRRWQQAHRELVNWKIDPTADLARVLRVPGTENMKSDPPAAVELLSRGPRCDPGDIYAATEHVRSTPNGSSGERQGRDAGAKIPRGEQHAHLLGVVERLVRGGFTDYEMLLRFLRVEFDDHCEDNAAGPGALEDMARWGADSDIAARERARGAFSINGDGPDEDEDEDTTGGPSDRLTRRLRRIYPTGADPRKVTSEALKALVRVNRPERVFVHGGALDRLLFDENGRPKLEQMDNDALAVEVMHAASFRGVKGPISTPKYVMPALRKLADYPGLPPIEAIVEAPVLRADGTVLDTPGYDAASRLYYHPAAGLVVPPIPTAPTQEQATEALEFVRLEVLNDFPFGSPADAANALGLLLTPIVRMLVELVPIALLTAPSRGTGKGLLAGACSQLTTGGPAPVFSMPEREEELRKVVDSMMLEGATFVFIDEVRELTSKSLQAVVTATSYKLRPLGRSSTVTVPQRATWMVAGNNVAVGVDLGRRSYTIRLDAKMARPWTRDGFRNPKLEGWVAEHRGELLAALLTAARAWWVAGQPPAGVPTIGSYEPWVETVGGILAYAGVSGFLGNLGDHWEQTDEDAAQWEGFLMAIRDRFDMEEWPTRDLAAAIETSGSDSDLRASLPDDLASAYMSSSFAIKLGRQISLRRDTRYGDLGLHLVRTRVSRNGQPRWRAEMSG